MIRLPVRRAARLVTPYAAVLVLSLAVLTSVLKLHRADLHVPFCYAGDGLVYSVWVKGMIEQGWYLRNPSVGAPAGLDMGDYPVPDLLHLLLLKGMSLACREAALTVNLYYLLTYPLAAGLAFFVLRRLRVSAVPAGVAALLFAFLPYHLVRGTGHLFLSAYYLVPLIVLVTIWLYREEGFLVNRPVSGWAPRPNLAGGRAVGALLVCLLVGLAGVYYAFFACFFLAIAGLAACAWRRTAYPLVAAGTLIAVTAAGVAVAVAPNLVHRQRHGENPAVAHRLPCEAELFGLKITQLLLPVPGHRLRLLKEARARYSAPPTPLLNENEFATLGLVGSVGFLVLLGRLLAHRARSGPSLLDSLSVLNVFGVLLATVGGFASLFSFYVSPMIRAYNRISVYLAFFALLAVAVLLDALLRRLAGSGVGRALGYALAVLVLAVGLLDQVPPLVLTPVSWDGQYRIEAAFVRQVEASVPPGAMIFQLPYVPFPESVPPGRMTDYDHFRAYLHSRSVRWSYGAMHGRAGDRWQRAVAEKPLPEMVQSLVLAGFSGIYLDRLGFADNGAATEAELSRLLGAGPLVSGNGRLSFFNLAGYRGELRQSTWRALLRLLPGQVDVIGGVRVHRLSQRDWSVDGGAAQSLLAAIDAVRRLAREREEAPGSSGSDQRTQDPGQR
jgi:phosphoglycerol transferase